MKSVGSRDVEKGISLLKIPKTVCICTSYFDNQQQYCGRDHMVVGFTTTYAIIAYNH